MYRAAWAPTRAAATAISGPRLSALMPSRKIPKLGLAPVTVKYASEPMMSSPAAISSIRIA
jgi:hypothetical protein